MTGFEKKLNARISGEVSDLAEFTPSLRVQVFVRGKKKADLALGEVYRFYDLASLTKLLFSASLAMRHVSDGSLNVDQTVRSYWPAWPQRSTTVRQLFTHSAGLPWWLPMYKKLSGARRPEARFAQLKHKLLKVGRKPSRRAIYSDVDLWVFGAFMTDFYERSLGEFWRELKDTGVFGRMHFNTAARPAYARTMYAPTERCKWRGRVLQGEVHDENTWAMGGIAPHAGLFGTIDDVAEWGLELRRGWRGAKSALGDSRVIRDFTRRQLPPDKGDWGLLFMKPTKGKASCGRHFSLDSFGHTGFTGTSLWLDPRRDLLVVILSNRVHPTRDNQKFVQLRPRLHDWIVEAL